MKTVAYKSNLYRDIFILPKSSKIKNQRSARVPTCLSSALPYQSGSRVRDLVGIC